MGLKNRVLIIVGLLIIGAVLATAVTKYIDTDEPLKHHVSSGKVGTNPDGTVWVAEFIKDQELFNYTLPASSVHSKYLYYSSYSIVAVPSYSQEFELERTEDGHYTVYVPAQKADVLVENLAEYMKQYENTVLLEAYSMFSSTVSDVQILSKIHYKPFAINGVVTMIHTDKTTMITGYILTVDDHHYMVMLDTEKYVKKVEEVDFEYK